MIIPSEAEGRGGVGGVGSEGGEGEGQGEGEGEGEVGGGGGAAGAASAASAAYLEAGSSRVTLLGDAGHPMSPFKGQGANQALLDALLLARALRGSELCGGKAPLRSALAAYEAEMMRRATPKVLKSREAAEQLHCAAATHPSNSTRAAAARESDRLFASGVR